MQLAHVGPYAFALTYQATRTVPKHWKRIVLQAARRALEGLPRKVLKALLKEHNPYTLHIALVTDARMRALNRQYRGKDRPTDVLSFSRLEGPLIPSPELEVGDLIIAYRVAERQSLEYGVSVAEELQRLTVHGTLHLFGYDHERGPKEAHRMFRLQNRILKELQR